MAEEIKPAAKAASIEDKFKLEFTKLVQAQLGSSLDGNPKDHGWGQKDSLAVIEGMGAFDASMANGDVKKFTLSKHALHYIERVVNPSAFRQVLEKLKMLNEASTGSRRTKVDDLFAKI